MAAANQQPVGFGLQPGIPTLKELSARTLSDLITQAVKAAAAATPQEWHALTHGAMTTEETIMQAKIEGIREKCLWDTYGDPTIPCSYWLLPDWLEAKEYLHLPEECVKSLVLDTKSLDADKTFLVWWLLPKTELELQVTRAFTPLMKKSEWISRQLVRFLAAATEATPPALSFVFLHDFNLRLALKNHFSRIKSLTLGGNIFSGAWQHRGLGHGKALFEGFCSLEELTIHFPLPFVLLQECIYLKKLNISSWYMSGWQYQSELHKPLLTLRVLNIQRKYGMLSYDDESPYLHLIPRLFPNITNLKIDRIGFSGSENAKARLSPVGHCLTEINCGLLCSSDIQLAEILKCCPRIRKLVLCRDKNRQMFNIQEEVLGMGMGNVDFCLPFLKVFRLEGFEAFNLHYRDLVRIVKGSPELKDLFVSVKRIIDFKQYKFVEMVAKGGNILRHLETIVLDIEQQPVMSEALLMALLALPRIRAVGGMGPSSLREDMDTQKRLGAVAKAKCLEFRYSYKWIM